MGSADRVARGAAIAAAVIWGVKALVIWAAGGLDESPLESPLFVLGLLAIVVACVALGVAAAGGGFAMKVGGGVAGLGLGLLFLSLCDALADAVLPSSTGWVEEEAGLWFTAAVVLAVALAWIGRRERAASV
jgi:hypothetical protein